MSAQHIDILLVEQSDELAELIADYVESAIDARIRRVRSAAQAITACAEHEPDVILSDMQLPDRDGLALARELRGDVDADTAIILMADHPTVGRAIEAMRLGVRDLFTKPFDLRRLSHVIEREAKDLRLRRRARRRTARLRRLASKVVRERRELRSRMDLLCQDLVGAYQQLARRVAELHASKHGE